MKILIWLKLTRERFIKRRSVSYITFDLRQEYYTAAVDRNDLKTIRRLLDLEDYQKIRRLHHTKGKLYPYKP
jgi:hypothetical protein